MTDQTNIEKQASDPIPKAPKKETKKDGRVLSSRINIAKARLARQQALKAKKLAAALAVVTEAQEQSEDEEDQAIVLHASGERSTAPGISVHSPCSGPVRSWQNQRQCKKRAKTAFARHISRRGLACWIALAQELAIVTASRLCCAELLLALLHFAGNALHRPLGATLQCSRLIACIAIFIPT